MTGTIVDEYLSEKEQIELIRNWWKENGRFVLTGLALGILILVGWRYWQYYVTKRAETASSSYAELLDAVEQQDRDRALELGERLVGSYDDTPYAEQAALALARLHVELNELEEAETRLRQVMTGAEQDELEHIARLRLARVLVGLRRAEEALTLLDRSDTGTFEPRYHELRGDVRLAMGDPAGAREEYQRALAAAEPGLADRTLLQMKLDDLPVEETPVPEEGDDESQVDTSAAETEQ